MSLLTCIEAAAFDVRFTCMWGGLDVMVGCRQITFFLIHFFISELCGALQIYLMRHNDKDLFRVEPIKERASPHSVCFVDKVCDPRLCHRYCHCQVHRQNITTFPAAGMLRIARTFFTSNCNNLVLFRAPPTFASAWKIIASILLYYCITKPPSVICIGLT